MGSNTTFYLSSEEKMLRDAVRDFAETRVRPNVMAMEEKGHLDKNLIKEIFEMGLMGIEIPERYQGAGSSFLSNIITIEELSKVDASVALFVDVQNTLVNNAILKWANDEQKKQFLPMLAKSSVGAFCLSEADAGSDAFAMTTRAQKEGSHYIINGSKLWISNAHEADIFLVFANRDPERHYKGIIAIIIEKNTDGVIIRSKENKLGIRATSTSEVSFENCKVPEKNIMGPLDKGYKVPLETLNEGRIGIAAQMVGIAQGALDATISYTKERKQFSKSIASFQGVQFQLAQMATQVEVARLMVYHAAKLKMENQSFLKEAAMAKYFCANVAEQVTSQAVDLFGGYGYIKEYPVEKFYRDAKIGKIYEGTSNIQLMTIAKTILS